MTTSPAKLETADVPTHVFEKFLQGLAEAKISPEVVSRLRVTLLVDKSFTERALRDAVLGEEVQP